MFRRRHQLHLIHRLRELLWPRAGWRRASRYLMHRTVRLPGSPYSIAAGFACGAAISFTPFVGFHFVLAASLAWLLGGSILASAVGTVVGNPWTFPFIWLWTYQFGQWMLGGGAMTPVPEILTLGFIFAHPGRVLLPMTMGSIPTAIVGWFIAYWLVRQLVARYQAHRRSRIAAASGGRGAGGRDKKAELP